MQPIRIWLIIANKQEQQTKCELKANKCVDKAAVATYIPRWIEGEESSTLSGSRWKEAVNTCVPVCICVIVERSACNVICGC